MMSTEGNVEELLSSGRIGQEDAEALYEALDEAEQRGASRGTAILSWTLLVVAAAVSLFFAAAICPLLNSFLEMFREMDLEGGLPALTELLFTVPSWGFALGFALLAVGLVAKEILIRRKSVCALINAAVLILLSLFAMFMVLALFQPMIHMMQALSETAS
jgi:type II secretory pathway component PulF